MLFRSLRRPGLLARSLLAVLVVAPALAIALVWVFDLNREVAIALVALSISPLPPLLPSRGERAGGGPNTGWVWCSCWPCSACRSSWCPLRS